MSFNLDGLSFGGSSSSSGGGGGGGGTNATEGGTKTKAAPFGFGGGGGPSAPCASSGGGGGGFSFGSPAASASGGSGAGGGGFSFGTSAPAPAAAAAATSSTAPAASASTSSFSFGSAKPCAAAAAGKTTFPFGSPTGAPTGTGTGTGTGTPAARSGGSSISSSSSKASGATAGAKKAAAAAAFPPMSSAASKPYGGSAMAKPSSSSSSSSSSKANTSASANSSSGAFPPTSATHKAPNPFGAKPPASTSSSSSSSSSGAKAAAAAGAFPPMSRAAPKPPSFGAGRGGGGVPSAVKAPPASTNTVSFGVGAAASAASAAAASVRSAPVTTPTTPGKPRSTAAAAKSASSVARTGLNFNDGALVPIGRSSGTRRLRRSDYGPSPAASVTNLAAVESKFPPEALGRMSCLGPDGRSVHSVAAASASAADTGGRGTHTVYSIVTHFLPLSGTTAGNGPDNGNGGSAYSYSEPGDASGTSAAAKRSVNVVNTALPEELAASLAVDPPIGLICVDAESSRSGRRHAQGGAHDDDDVRDGASLPLLCLYTARSAFVLRTTYTVGSHGNNEAAGNGTIESSFEPFEHHLLSASSSTRIVTILPGPGCGYQSTLLSSDVVCRPGSMLALMAADGEDSLVLFHGGTSASAVTVPLKRGYEDLGSDSSDTLVGVCFASPSPAAAGEDDSTTVLFPSLSVLLLSRTGCVHAASPIVFDGALYSTRAVVNASQYLRDEIDRLDNNDPAKPEEAVLWRRARAAAFFIDEAFGTLTDRSIYVKASALTGIRDGPQSSKEWPISIQGPMLAIPDADDVPSPTGTCGSCIVPFSGTGTGSSLVSGFAVGRIVSSSDGGTRQPRVDIGILSSGATIFPRFEFESEADADCVDEMLEGVAAFVESVQFESPDASQADDLSKARTTRCTLIPDPVDGSTLHHVSSSGVVTVTTNAVDLVGRKLGGNGYGREEISTSAWSLLEVSSPAALEGVGVSGDAHLGHILVARSSDGSMEAINITAAQYLQEASKLASKNVAERALVPVSSAQTESDEALKAMESVPPLHELIAPIIQDVSSGLAGMGKIIGGATRPQDATPGSVATVLDTKASCEKEVILPLKQLHRLTTARRQLLQDMYESQMNQIEQLRNMVDTLRERMDATNDKQSVAEANATALSQRSAAVLSAARDLVPSITEAEYQYFMQIKRYDASSKKWQGHIDTMKKRADKLCDTAGSNPCALEISADDMTHMTELLKGQGNQLKLSTRKFDKLDRETKRIMKAAGMNDDSGGEGNGKENVQGQ